ncbi:MAG TPA: amidohydrolase family protein [Acidimicrobiia bacterium]
MNLDPRHWGDRWGVTRVTPPDHVTVDCHSHMKVAEAVALAKPHLRDEDDPRVIYSSEESKSLNAVFHAESEGRFTDPAVRIADMDGMGIDVQMVAIAPPQYFYPLPAEVAGEVARVQNDRLIAVANSYPDRFVAVGTLPMNHPELAVEEVDRIHRAGVGVVEIGADVAGQDLDHPRFDPVWEALAARQMVVIMHPHGFTEARRLTDYYLVNVIGIPVSSTLAVVRMILGGVFARHPGLRMLVMHGGGYLSLALARADHAFAHRPELRHHIDRPPSTFAEQLYFETCVFDPSIVDDLVARYGVDHVLMGTDYPFDMGQGDPLGFLAQTSLSPEQLALVTGGNARNLFGIDIDRPTRGEKR